MLRQFWVLRFSASQSILTWLCNPLSQRSKCPKVHWLLALPQAEARPLAQIFSRKVAKWSLGTSAIEPTRCGDMRKCLHYAPTNLSFAVFGFPTLYFLYCSLYCVTVAGVVKRVGFRCKINGGGSENGNQSFLERFRTATMATKQWGSRGRRLHNLRWS